MSAKKFKFVSPGVFLSEIDNSQLPRVPGGVGPVVIGRTRRGPALKPVKVSSFQEFVEVFGDPVPGNEGEDPWRDGNGLLAPAYAPLAAQAYLKADINSPVTVIRLLGVQGDDANDDGAAGWEASNAFGIFVGHSASNGHHTASLCGILYTDVADNTVKFGVKGSEFNAASETVVTSLVSHSVGGTGTPAVAKILDMTGHSFNVIIQDSNGQLEKEVSFRKGGRYIRDVLNTNPVATNGVISSPAADSKASVFWLGETFEEEYERIHRVANGNQKFVFVSRLSEGMDDFKSADHQLTAARSGWVIPQHKGAPAAYDPTTLQKLFRFIAIDEGEAGLSLNIKIENIKISEPGDPSPFGRFDVVVEYQRSGQILTVESFENLNLNPNSDNFIARRIGDQYLEWDGSQKRNKVYGSYPNQSSYIRVEMDLDVGENGPTNQRSVPFGFLGPLVPKDSSATMTAGTAAFKADTMFLTGAFSIARPSSGGNNATALTVRWPEIPHVITGSRTPDLSAKYVFGGTRYDKVIGDVSGTVNFSSVNPGIKDYLRRYGTFGTLTTNQDSGLAGTSSKYSYIFSLDNVVVTGATNLSNDMSAFRPTSVSFVSGSQRSGAATATVTFTGQVDDSRTLILTSTDGTERTYRSAGGNDAANLQYDRTSANAAAAGLKLAIEGSAGHNGKILVSVAGAVVTLTQATAGTSGNKTIGGTLNSDGNATVDAAFTGGKLAAFTAFNEGGTQLSASALLDVVDSFSMPLHGGFDGVNIVEADPFNMSTRAIGPDSTTRNSYAHASVDRAIELISDPEALEMNLAVMPGITNLTLTRKLIQTCEARADALGIIDLPDVYVPPAQKRCTSFKDRVDDTNPVKSAKALKARQLNSSYGAAYYPWVKIRDTINSRDVWVPPSVVALGVMGYTEERDEVWFAPAGFNRGGLNEGNAGLPVLQASEQLLSSQRDALYDANINPIASFVSEGLVVFGQKTLQMTPSALDRINVRRLLIFVKKEISRIANGLLFDQNVPATWNRFTGQVVPFLESVKTRLGLTDFKVVLDSSTTTPDLVDRNVMYAKIFLKPARAIEFIAVDFVITRTGASFDD